MASSCRVRDLCRVITQRPKSGSTDVAESRNWRRGDSPLANPHPRPDQRSQQRHATQILADQGADASGGPGLGPRRRRRHHALGGPCAGGRAPRHGADLPDHQPQQALGAAGPHRPQGPQDPGEADQVLRRLRRLRALRRSEAPGPRLRGRGGDEARHRLCPRRGLRLRWPLCRRAGLRRPDPIGLGPGRRPAAHRRRLHPAHLADLVADNFGPLHGPAPLPPCCTGRAPARPVRRGADAGVRHQLHPGGAPYDHAWEPAIGQWATPG